ncbi:helix-turn-helix transcriptional regulator [Sphingobium sp. HWE2-09]|uniref:helix-turn-helix transcriptional regulator n=1 Tax=Sphingobium sp. HWE2-09 TaxID=3108390 RepID=UPI002DD31653|nr:helix-turn-helix domain-containing protein [Sphingobium sp. HWE2-09]
MTKRITSAKHLTRTAYPAVSASVLKELLGLLADHGLCAQPLLDEAGLPWPTETILKDGWNHPIPHGDFARFYALCVSALDREASRREGRLPFRKAEFDMLCHCVITCTSLGAAIARLLDFVAMLHPRLGQHRLEIDGQSAIFVMDPLRDSRNAAAYLTDLTGLSSFSRLFGWLIGEKLAVIEVDMDYSPRGIGQMLVHLMPYPIRHQAGRNALRFPATLLERPVRRNAADLEAWLDHFPYDPIEPQSFGVRHVELVEGVFQSALERGARLPSAKMLAARFAISVGTLNRRLADEGTTLRAIKQRARIDRAQRLLADPRISISEVARLTNYADYTALSRAFRAATGLSPSVWRGGHPPRADPDRS